MRRGLWLFPVLALGCGRLGFDELEAVTPEQARGTLSVGVGFACTIRDGDVWCWGEGRAGQLGIAEPEFAAEPVQVAQLPEISFVAAGNNHVCAVAVGGDVFCWGSNDWQQLGIVSPQTEKPGLRIQPFPVPVRVDALPGPAIAVGAGSEHSCALLEDRTVWCWGANRTGALGRGNIEDVPELPAVVPGISDVADLAIADDTSCVRHTTGAVACWGEGGTGHLGDGTDITRGTPKVIPDLIADALTLGGDHACALVGGRYTCWGANPYGQHGDGSDQGGRIPKPLSLVDGFVAITAAFDHTCALRDDGTVFCWGANFEGNLGDGTEQARSSPVEVDNGGAVAAVAAGLYSTCAIRVDNRVECWGWGSRGAVGDGRSASATARRVELDASMVAANRYHTCAVVAGGNVECWGLNDAGQLGDNTQTLRTVPVMVARKWTADVQLVTVGDHHSCALTTTGEVWCWGENNDGQLGDGTDQQSFVPVQAQVGPMTTVDAGDFHTCGIRAGDSRVLCWGYNELGQLGNGSTVGSKMPVEVIDGTGTPISATQLVVGENSGCALTAGDDVVCWGLNNRGQLGVTGGNRDNATLVPGVTGDGLVGGANAVCVTDSNPTPLCWGANDDRILDPDDGDVLAPRRHTNPNGFVMSRATACGSDGCWGGNFLGQLGDGTFQFHSSPVPISGVPSAPTAFAPGYDHTCALVGSEVYCWGDNLYGQLGSGIRTRALEPVGVVGLP